MDAVQDATPHIGAPRDPNGRAAETISRSVSGHMLSLATLVLT